MSNANPAITTEEEAPEAILPCAMTPQQKQAWGDTMSLMAWTAPGFRHLFYKLLANNDGEYAAVPTKSIPVAATDAKNILINPDRFFEMQLKERVFVIAHEVVHNVYGDVELLHRCFKAGKVPMHDGTELPFREDLMQKAMDYRINALLVDSRIGSMPKNRDINGETQAGLYDTKIAGANDSVYDVYRKLYEDDPDGDKQGKGPKGFDVVLSPGKSTGQNPNSHQRNQQQWAVQVGIAQTLEAMNAKGKLPAGLQRMFQDILEPEIPWTDHIQAILARRVGSGSYNWRRPDRRGLMNDICLPSRSGHGAGWIVVWGDTSGSIGEKQLNSYMAELSGIIEDVRPKRLTVIWCDAAIHRIDEMEEPSDLANCKSQGVGGGGGTSCMPVFEWIAEGQEVPDMFIGLTDGYVDFPPVQPVFPVIWATVAPTKYPWGDVVEIKRAQEA